jgi:hypothetical protein
MRAAGTPPPSLLDTAPPGAGFRTDPVVQARARPRDVILVGTVASLAAWLALVVTAVLISEVAASATFEPGVASSSWTPLRGVGAFVVGAQAYGGGFSPLPILYGLAALLVYSVLFGVLGVALIVAFQGPRPGVVGALVQGVVYGGFVQALVVNAVVTGLVQDQPTVYESMPSWGWWVANGAFGAALGLVTAAMAPTPRGIVAGAPVAGDGTPA